MYFHFIKLRYMEAIQAKDYPIVFNTSGYNALATFLENASYSRLFILVDNHTHEYCLNTFLGYLRTTLPMEIVEIPSGELNKTINTCNEVWMALADLEADRKGLIINLGGGVVTDLGGFVASTFKRGIDFINIPTSLLAMVDASVGGKTGVDLGTLKNLVGVINNPKMVLIDTGFLASLPKNEMRSGLAEMYKHGLIADHSYWERLSDLQSLSIADLNILIYDSIIIKNTIVLEDPKEHGIRKTLNFGHTLGHAIESYCLQHKEKQTLLHGEAIAIGIILESYLSKELCNLSEDAFLNIHTVLRDMYEPVSFTNNDITEIIALLKHDKKNDFGRVNFVLLDAIGNPKINQQAPNALIHNAFECYTSSAKN